MKKLLITLALVGATSAHAEFYTGNELLAQMRSSSMHEQGVALGYVAGVADSFTKVTICIPANSVTLGQAVDVVRQHLESNPDRRHFSADSLAYNALFRAWPCADKKPVSTRGASL